MAHESHQANDELWDKTNRLLPDTRIAVGHRRLLLATLSSVSLGCICALLLLLASCGGVFIMRTSLASLLVAGLSMMVGGAVGQICDVDTVRSTIPTGKNLALQSYSYCGGNLNVTVRCTPAALSRHFCR